MIKIQKVTKTFHLKNTRIHALRDIDLDVPAKSIFGVIGASGAGKSTLIRLVNLLERPTQGKVIVDNVDLTELSNQALTKERQKIGMIFQHFNLLSSRNVSENIALPLELANTSRAHISKKVTELLELVGLSNKKDAYPANLSGGQKQRVAIARALACDPKILLCDEATSALDPATTHTILALLQKINQELGITILMITHEMDVVKKICHQVAIISDGKLIEQGSVGDIFAHPKTTLAKEFIRATLNLAIPQDYQDRLQAEQTPNTFPLVRLEFTGKSVDAPLISKASAEFNVGISILSADMDYAGGVKFGLMLAEFFGETENVEQALNFLSEHHVNAEVLGYVA